MSNRQTKFVSYTAVYAAVVIAGLTIVNVLADRHNKSIDTTANKRFSLSDQTEKIVKNLKAETKAYYFDRTSRFESARGMLDRYSNLSTNFKVEYVDPDKDPAKARAMGARSYGTLILDGGAKREEAKAISEQEITGALVRMQQAGDQTVCAFEGHGEKSFDAADTSGMSTAKTALERNNYKTQTVKIVEKADIPPACSILLIAGPKRAYNDEVIAAVKAFVEKGGDAMFLLSPALKGRSEEVDDDPKLNALLESWNITVQNNLLFDASGVSVIAADEYSQHPIVRDMRGLPAILPLARALDVKTGAEKLITSSGDAMGTKTLDITKLQSSAPSKDFSGPFTVAAATTVGGTNAGDIKKQGRVVVAGSSEWLAAAMFGRYGNRDLFLNMINWLSADEDLISIRPKEPEDRRLTVKPSQGWILYATSFLPTLLVLGGGILVWLKRR
ncbi:MAG: hypothetical protein FJW30_12900 [Acidobacteria bacterium]|nr:hypothetical protein [Acidobacteriota bacterium]